TPTTPPTTPTTPPTTPTTPPTTPTTSTTLPNQQNESGKDVLPNPNQQRVNSSAVIHNVVNISEEVFSKVITIIENIFHKL
ncbi:MAG: hypothetical protein KGH89_09060, partial [Thaumarchaeota archaeon]|nr:hypothetical protein [Nitrososphaerota archaeon]